MRKATQSNQILRTRRPFLCLLALLGFWGCQIVCGCVRLQPIAPADQSRVDRSTPAHDRRIIPVLYQQVKAWQGVPYKYGGLSKNGVDCSGFVQETFRTEFRIALPRTAYQQSRKGEPVLRHDLRAGDLVFFRLGYNLQHVGIYIENNRFAHASTSRGVTVSNLKNPYWSQRYWKARRIPGIR